MESGSRVKAILGYDIAEGVSVDEYQRWLWQTHYPDLLANPYLDKVVFNKMIEPINKTSAGTPIMDTPEAFYAIAELHYADREAYDNYLRWFENNPIPVERSPAGRSEFKFYVLTEVTEAVRED